MKFSKSTRVKINYIYLLFFFFSFLGLTAQDKSFPTAVGAGAFSRSDVTYTHRVVTNLNDSGPGSFRDAMQSNSIVSFNVSGLALNHNTTYAGIENLIVLGQTAPDGGFQYGGPGVRMEYIKNLSIRYVSFRNTWFGRDAFDIIGAENILIDHCSYSFGADETLSFRASYAGSVVENISITNTHLNFGKTGMLLGDSDDFSKTSLTSSIGNLWSVISHRFPNANGSTRIDVFGNVVYDWANRLMVTEGNVQLNEINNAYIATDTATTRNQARALTDGTPSAIWEPSIFSSGNVHTGIGIEATDDQWGTSYYVQGQHRIEPVVVTQGIWQNRVIDYATESDIFPLPTDYRASGMHLPLLNFDVNDLQDADWWLNKTTVEKDVGNNARLDDNGNRIEQIQPIDASSFNRITNSISYNWSTALDYKNIPELVQYKYTDYAAQGGVIQNTHDPSTHTATVSNAWIIANGMTLDTFDPMGNDLDSLYTNIEMYSFEIDNYGPIEIINATSISVTPSTEILNINDTLELTKEVLPIDATDKTGSWDSSNTTIATVSQSGVVTALAPGTITVTFTTTDGNLSASSEITVLPEALQASASNDQQICEGENITLEASGGSYYVWSTGETTETIEVTPDVTTTYTVTVSDDFEQSEEVAVTITVNTVPIAFAGDDQTICVGDTITLTATGGLSYLWSTGETTDSIVINPTEETTYSVEVSNDNCSSIDEVIVIVNELPLISINEDIVIVNGETTTLTATGADNYEWNTGETTDSISVNPTETTTYSVSTVGVGNCSNSAFVTVTVIPEVIAYAGEDITICNGETVTISATGGSYYLWETGELESELIVSPIETTIYSVTVEDEYGYVDTDEVTIFVNDTPEIILTEDVVIVVGESTVLTVTGSDSYEWNTGETTSTISITPEVSSTYSVTALGTNGCSSTADVIVTVVPEVVAYAGEDITICDGETITLSATGGSTYIWNTGEEVAEFVVTPSETTTYTVTVEDEYGFTDTDEITIFVNESPDITVNDEVFIMLGNSATLTADGANSFIWNTGETTSEIMVSPEVDTTYTVTGEGVNGCQTTVEIVVTVIEMINANAGEDVSICLGESLTLHASGGITYTWNSGATGATQIISPTETTTYTVTVTDDYGNVDSDDVIVTVNPVPTVNAGEDFTTCLGEAVTLTATAQGGNSFLWTTGETTESITVNPTEDTVYTVEVSNGFCSFSDDTTVFVLPISELVISDDIVIITGNSVTLEVSGGESYLWNTGEVANTIVVSPTETTTYDVTDTLENGCISTAQVTVTVVPEVIADAGEDIAICIGESVNLNASGGGDYLWSNGETSASINITPTETTVYTVTVNDSYGNSDSESITVTVNELPIISLSEDIVIFEGASTTLTVNGAETYLWNNGETTDSIIVSPMQTTTYSVIGYSINDCQTEGEVTVTVIPVVDANAGMDVEICEGESVVLSATGGTYYTWSTGETTASINISPTSTETYTVIASDDYGNSDSDSVIITVYELPNITLNEDILLIEGESSTLTVSGGVTYLWSNGETSNSINVNPTETTTYSVTAYSENGCEMTDEVTITVIPEVFANAGEDVVICLGGSVLLNASGSTNYLWNTGQNTSSITVNPTETTTYTVTVSDDYGNFETDNVTVTVNDITTVSISDNVVIFEGESTDLSIDGGETYSWDNGETSSTITVSPTETTTYSVVGYIEGGCEFTLSVTVIVLPVVIADAGSDVTICSGESITLVASGNSYYEWDTGETTASITVSPAVTSTYIVTVFDIYGNSDSDDVIVTVNESPIVTVSENISIIEGESTELIANGANMYLWSTGASTNSIIVNPTSTTTYSVSGFSILGCQTTEEVTVTVIPQVNANAGEDVSICNGESVTLNVTGGGNYLWDSGETTSSITVNPTETTTYMVTVSDSFGYSDSDSVTVTVNELPIVTVSENITIIEGESTELIANGASTYLWNTGATSNSISVSPIVTTTYLVTGTTNTCEAQAEVNVTVIPQVNANAGDDASICYGESVTLNATGGGNYLWDSGDTSSSLTVNPTETTTYMVTVSDSFGYSDSDSVTVTVNELPIVTVSENITIIEGESTELIVNGASTYLWNTGATSNSISVSPAVTTTYLVTGTTNTCEAQAEVTVTVTPLFVASAGVDERICDNQNYEILLTANQGDGYLWSTGETTQTILVNPLSTTTYSVVVSHGNQEDSDDVTVFVDPSPYVVISNGENIDILNGDFVTLSASGANTYEWNNGASQPNIAVSPSITTTYEVRGYVGDCYDDKQVTVNVINPVIADAGDDIFICLNETATLTATGGDEYVWSNGEITQTIQVSPTETTDYTVTVFNALDFDEATVRVEVDLNCTDGSENPTIDDDQVVFDFNVYPNPATTAVFIKLSSNTELISDIHVFDVSGKLVHEIKINNSELNPTIITQLDVSTLQSGVYFIKLINLDRTITKKLIVE